MNDRMKRLLEGELSPAERSVLESVRLDGPSAEAMKRSAEVLGLSPAAATATGVSLSTWTLVGLVSLGVLGAVAFGPFGRPTPEASPVRVESPPPAPRVEAPSPIATVPAPAAEVSAAPPQAPRSAPPPRQPASLEDQIARMDRARTALGAGRAKEALDEVMRYRSAYPRGAFGQEATVIRIQALVDLGQKSRARVEGRAFLERYPSSPHATRIARDIE